MPNWVDTNWQVTLPTNKVTRFLNYFLESEDKDKLRGKYLYRTFIDKSSISQVETEPDITCLAFVSQSAWSLESILNDSGIEKGIVRCPSLDKICVDCDVINLSADGDEPCMCFREHILWDLTCGLSYDKEDVTPWSCDHCSSMGYWEDYDENIDHSVCPECGHKFNDEEDN